MKLIFLRHGQADHNRSFRINEDNSQPSVLTKTGQEQAEKAGKKIADQKIDFAYCSPLVRAKQTAKIVLEAHPDKIPLKVDRRLNEFQTGLNQQLMWWWSLRLFFSRDRMNKKFKDGQSFNESAEPLADWLKEALKKHYEETILVVAHLHTYQVLMAYYEKIPLKDTLGKTHYLLGTGEIYEFELKDPRRI